MNNQEQSQRAALAGWLVCMLGAVFYGYEYLLRVEPSVMVQELKHHFFIGERGFGFLVGFYYFAYTPLQLLVGVLTDILGPRRILTWSVGFCALGSYLFALPQGYFDSTTMFVIACFGRFMVGFGSAFAFVGVLKLAVLRLRPERFAIFSGLANALGMVGAMAGDTGLVHLIQHVGWQDTVYFTAAFGIMLIPLLWFTIDDKHNDDSGNRQGYYNAFKPVFQSLPTIIKSGQVWIAGVIACLFFLSLAVFAETWGVQFISSTYDVSRPTAANLNAAVFAGWLVGGALVGLISDSLRIRKWPLIIGAALSLILIIPIIYWPVFTPVQLWLMLFGYGVASSVEIICFSLGRENAPSYVSGTALSFINMLTMLSGMVFQPIVAYLLAKSQKAYWSNWLSQFGVNPYQAVLGLLPLSCVVVMIIGLLLRETHARPVYSEAA